MSKIILFICLLSVIPFQSVFAKPPLKKPIFSHSANKFLWNTQPWLWANDKPEDASKKVVQYGNPYSADNPMAVRMQFWIDQFDKAFRDAVTKNDPENAHFLSNIPKPFIIITDGMAPNAFAESSGICLNADAKLANAHGTKILEGIHLSRFGTIGIGDTQLWCANPATNFTTQEVVDFFNSQSQFCKLSLDASTVTLSSECLAPGLLAATLAGGKRLTIDAASSSILFTKGLLLGFNTEDEMLGALFHELGHYYRAHAAVAADSLNYFFKPSENIGVKPVPAADFMDLTTSVRSFIRINVVNKFQTSFANANQAMIKNNLDFYTVEQEADEYSAEFLTMMGYSVTPFIESLLSLGIQWEKTSGVAAGALSSEECNKLYLNNWKNEAGEDVVIPVGDLKDAHHSVCFRAHNLYMENLEHKYNPAANPKVLPPAGPSFNDLQKTL